MKVSDDQNLASERIIVPVVVIVLIAIVFMVIYCQRDRRKRITEKCPTHNEHVVPSDYGHGRPWEHVEWPGCSAKNLMRLSVTPPGWAAPLAAIEGENINRNCSDV